MVSANPGKNPNPSSEPQSKPHSDFRSSKNVFHIGGTPVEFPYQPYGTQLAFMGRVISTLDRAQKDGHCHALLESPTGTGKSLSLLCSTIAWQQNYKMKSLSVTSSQLKPAPEAFSDPLNHGGGFVPEVQPSEDLRKAGQATEPTQQPADSKAKKIPTIYYSSRTHSQISQVIREYRKTGYRVPMAVLASRKNYCTNPSLRGRENIDEECKMLLRNREGGCKEFKNVGKLKAHPSLQRGGCHDAHDIEDLVKVGQVVKGCSYYAARSMAEDAQLVFCPYNYIINPVIRGAMNVDIKGAILIFDEAHNIEDIARDAGSVDIEVATLEKLHFELEGLSPIDALIYQPLYEMTQELINLIDRRKNTLEKREFQHYVSCWTGNKAVEELQGANITQQCFPILLDCATKAIKASTDVESVDPHLSGLSVLTLEGLFSALTHFFSRGGCHIIDYQLAIQKYMKRDTRVGRGLYETLCLSLWCLNPAVVFKDIADLSLSVILTSGTLSPMTSFTTELGAQFGTCLEAPHVIDVKSQVWAGIISSGPENYPLNASFKTADAYEFQDALGKSLEGILKIVPGGSLVFFPSYKLMEKLCSRWQETGQWSRLSLLKSLFVEPRGGSQEDFEPVLKGYYHAIRGGKRPAFPKKKIRKSANFSQSHMKNAPEEVKNDGAVFFAVCRGKVSEGIDFSDSNARAVIIVGIPFPNVHDIQVGLKKRYNDTYNSSKNLLSGSEWYCHQAFRALNQAAGRCLRHIFDYGAIIFIDERFRQSRNRAHISKWMRNSVEQYDSYDASLEALKSFFSNVKERVDTIKANLPQTSCINEEAITCLKESTVPAGKKTGNETAQNANKAFNAMLALKRSRANVEAQKSVPTAAKDKNRPKEYIDLESDFGNTPRCCTALPNEFEDDPDCSIFKETPGVYNNTASPSLGSHFRDDNSGSTIIGDSSERSDHFSPHSMSTAPSRGPSVVQCSTITTPERELLTDALLTKPEVESSLNLSVNSHSLKRRKFAFSPVVDIRDDDQSNVIDADWRRSPASRNYSRKIEFSGNDGMLVLEKPNGYLPRILKDIAADSVSSISTPEKRLQISCSLCRSPLGLPQNNQCINGSLSSSSKVHLGRLLDGETKPAEVYKPASTQVLVTDTSLLDPQLFRNSPKAAPQEGIWCEEDGCVFKSIFCPSCTSSRYCLGVQIMATDTSNAHLLDKVLFLADRLEVKDFEAVLKNFEAVQDSSPKMTVNENDALKAIERFSYTPKTVKSGGWRTTRSKLRLPRGAILSTEDD